MSALHLAWRTRPGALPYHDRVEVAGAAGSPPLRITAPARLVVAHRARDGDAFVHRWRAADRSDAAPASVLRALGEEACLCAALDPAGPGLSAAAAPGVLHFFRHADGTVNPLPPATGPLACLPGDAYVALTLGVQRLADGPTVARFLHLRDDFNAEKLAHALIAHLLETAGLGATPDDVTVLVVEAR